MKHHSRLRAAEAVLVQNEDDETWLGEEDQDFTLEESDSSDTE